MRNQLVQAKYARYHRLWAERWLVFVGPAAEQDADSVQRRYVFSTSNCVYTGMALERYETILDVWRREGNYA